MTMNSTVVRESILSILPGAHERERVLVMLLTGGGQEGRISLRQQSYGEGVGWFTQNTLDMDTTQAAYLRNALGGASATVKPRPRPIADLQAGDGASYPRILRMESA